MSDTVLWYGLLGVACLLIAYGTLEIISARRRAKRAVNAIIDQLLEEVRQSRRKTQMHRHDPEGRSEHRALRHDHPGGFEPHSHEEWPGA